MKLYKENRKRGTFSYGGLLIGSKVHAILKTPGVANLTNKLIIEYGKTKRHITDFNVFLGHTQAPTSAQRAFTAKTSHPFQYKEWIVAHNGVLTNDKELKKLIPDKKAYNVVDSSVIAPLLTKHHKETKDEIVAIKNTCSMLKGTFGLWIYNQQSANVYLARSGSTLFADYLNNMFSSTKYSDFVALDEGVIYLLTTEGITAVGKFASNSPFFTS